MPNYTITGSTYDTAAPRLGTAAGYSEKSHLTESNVRTEPQRRIDRPHSSVAWSVSCPSLRQRSNKARLIFIHGEGFSRTFILNLVSIRQLLFLRRATGTSTGIFSLLRCFSTIIVVHAAKHRAFAILPPPNAHVPRRSVLFDSSQFGTLWQQICHLHTLSSLGSHEPCFSRTQKTTRLEERRAPTRCCRFSNDRTRLLLHQPDRHQPCARPG